MVNRLGVLGLGTTMKLEPRYRVWRTDSVTNSESMHFYFVVLSLSEPSPLTTGTRSSVNR
jgi:hypothetical protein